MRTPISKSIEIPLTISNNNCDLKNKKKLCEKKVEGLIFTIILLLHHY